MVIPEIQFRSNRASVVVPEILESVISVQQRFCVSSTNSVISDLGQTELLW